jgi:hypothetical protein
MTKTLISTLGLLAAVGCSSDQPRQQSQLSRATAAIAELDARDAEPVAQCRRAVDACNARLPDAAPAEVCTRIAARCDALEAQLAEVRGPARSCWQSVQACEQHTTDPTTCDGDAARCDTLAASSSEDRSGVVACEQRVQDCLTRAETLPAAALGACDNMAAACERVTAIQEEHAADRADAGDDQDEASDEDDGPADEDDGPADEDDPGEARPDAGAGHAHGRPQDVPRGRGAGGSRDADAGVDD